MTDPDDAPLAHLATEGDSIQGEVVHAGYSKSGVNLWINTGRERFQIRL